MRILISVAENDPIIAAIAALEPLRDTIAQNGLNAKHSLGQHFLLDLNVTGRIARYVPDMATATLIEVGPGPGGLTRALLLAGATKLVAIERDERAVAALAPLVTAAAGRLSVDHGDALEFDYLAYPAPRQVVSNLPYNVGTLLLLGWLEKMEQFSALTLMFQKEVAQRLVAQPNSKAYGRLSVMAQWRAEVRKLFDLPARAFTPPPKVDSSVVQLLPRQPQALEPSWKEMETVVAAAFGQRRKMLRAALKSITATPEELCESVGIAPTARAETLTVDQFRALTLAWRRAK